MSRGFSTAQATALASQLVRPVTFAKLEFGNGTLYLHNSIGTHTWSGQDWSGVGDFASVDTIQEGEEISPFAVRLTLSGLDSNLSNQALTQDYFQKPATLYLGLLDGDDELIDTPLEIFTGLMDQLSITIGTDGNDAIQLTCESPLARFAVASNVKYTNETQQRETGTADKFFEFGPSISGLKVAWRSPTSSDGGGIPGIPTAPPGEAPVFPMK